MLFIFLLLSLKCHRVDVATDDGVGWRSQAKRFMYWRNFTIRIFINKNSSFVFILRAAVDIDGQIDRKPGNVCDGFWTFGFESFTAYNQLMRYVPMIVMIDFAWKLHSSFWYIPNLISSELCAWLLNRFFLSLFILCAIFDAANIPCYCLFPELLMRAL